MENRPPHEAIIRHLDTVLPKEKVIQAARTFLKKCGWKLELNEYMISISKKAELYVRSRAFIKADASHVFLDDHYEAVVLVGVVRIDDYLRARYCVLKMYFNLAGQFVSEDQYDRYS